MRQKTSPPTPVQASGLYINGFVDILPDSSARTELITFLAAKNITFVILYLSALLDNAGNRTLMRALNVTLAGMNINSGANVTQADNAVNEADAGTPAAFNLGCATSNEKFKTFIQEWEFWKSDNPYGDFNTFKTDDIRIANWCRANGVAYNIYVARCKDAAGVYTDAQVAEHLVYYHDTIFLVDYVSTAKYNTYKGLSDGIKTQIQLIAAAAKKLGKVQKIQILWASEGNIVSGVPTNMRSFFVANPTLIPAYNGFKTVYTAWSFADKAYVAIPGQVIYGLQGIKDL